jgi:dephospho-CoA kinase
MKPFRLGLTGSIGMGKSTTAQLFAAEGIPVWDADATVHRLYAPGQPAAKAIATRFPTVMEPDGSVSRPRLRALIAAAPTVLDTLNALVHPLVAADRAAFVASATADIVLLDIPLLFETNAQSQCDTIAVATVPADIQRQRVLARGMTEADFQIILNRQLPDAEKRARADFIIQTFTLDMARAAVKHVLADIRRKHLHPHA